MEELFKLSEKLTIEFNSAIKTKNQSKVILHFDHCLIKQSSFEILFENSDIKIFFSLSTHHLDMPWYIDITTTNENGNISLNNRKCKLENKNIVYEVYPNLLNDLDNLGSLLVSEIIADVIQYLNE